MNEQEQPLSTENFSQRIDVTKIITGVDKIRTELKKVIVGQDELINFLLIGLFSNGHCLIEGVPGIAKTVTSKLLAASMHFKFSRIQFTPDLMPSDVLGTSVFNQKIGEFEYKKGPIYANIVLIDEINRAPAKTQSALFEVMAEQQITMDGITHKMENPFLVFATQNPIEQEGTYRLPEAQLDRFLFKIVVDYPDLNSEIKILQNFNDRKSDNSIDSIEPVLSNQDVLNIQSIIQNIVIEHKLMEYIARIVNSTRNHPSLFLGASPRASLAILKTAKTQAALSGRDFVIPEDIKHVLKPALRHRIIVSPEKEMEGITSDMIIEQIINEIEIPR